MNRFPYFVQKCYDLKSSAVTANYFQSVELGKDDYNSPITHWTLGILESTPVNTNFSRQVGVSSYKRNKSMSNLPSIYLNTYEIIQSIEIPSSEICGFKNTAYLIRINNEQVVHFGSIYL